MPRYNDYDYQLLDQVIIVNPEDESDFIASDKPVVVEVGCGNGHFLTSLATDTPDASFYGIDIKRERLIRCIEKKLKNNLDNINYICGDGKVVLQKKFADESVSKMFMTFPDPWPKTRHHKNRLFKEDFVDIVWSKLISNADFIFITDFEPYYLWAKDIIDRDSRFEVTTASKDDKDNVYLTKSLFGQKWEQENRSYYVLIFNKKAK